MSYYILDDSNIPFVAKVEVKPSQVEFEEIRHDAAGNLIVEGSITFSSRQLVHPNNVDKKHHREIIEQLICNNIEHEMVKYLKEK